MNNNADFWLSRLPFLGSPASASAGSLLSQVYTQRVDQFTANFPPLFRLSLYMALTQTARRPGPSWDETIVPALRKRAIDFNLSFSVFF